MRRLAFRCCATALAQAIARGIALVLLAIPIFGLRQGPGFPGFNALAPCIGAAMFIWSGIGVPTPKRSRTSPLNVAKFFGQISYSLYLWHWPLFTFARFSKNSLVLDTSDKIALFALTVVLSYLSWRFVEQPFRRGRLAPTRRAAFRFAGLASVVLLAAGAGGMVLSRTPSDADRAALQLESYNAYDFQPLYRSGSCFTPARDVLDEACLALASGKTNVLLWGDSLAAHYFHGLSKTAAPRSRQYPAGDAGGLHADVQRRRAGHGLVPQLCLADGRFFRNRKPDLVILSADWLEYARPPRFDGMIADLRQTIARLNALGIPVVLLGPAVQFRSRLPSMLMRAHLRQVDARPDDFVLPDIFALDRKDEGGAAGAREVFLRLGGRCGLSGAAMPAHDRRRHSAGVGSRPSHRGGIGLCDGAVGAAIGAEIVIPGRRGASNPEFRDSGFALMRAPE